jgi:lipopolysaccharide/colanic/teichoic acid biosynthesis glycosyltransferase
MKTKRMLDLVVVLTGLPVALPLMAVIAALIRFDSGRPLLFRQVRVGQGGRSFVLLKFRTMLVGCSASGPDGRVLEDAPLDRNDPGITRVGAWLRRTGLDELPQLLNVLRGDMSMVGPRPTIPAQAERYGEFERERLSVPPGLTGLAQISGRSDLSWPDRIRIDVRYARNRSLWLDIGILFKTVGCLLKSSDVRHQPKTQHS